MKFDLRWAIQARIYITKKSWSADGMWPEDIDAGLRSEVFLEARINFEHETVWSYLIFTDFVKGKYFAGAIWI